MPASCNHSMLRILRLDNHTVGYFRFSLKCGKLSSHWPQWSKSQLHITFRDWDYSQMGQRWPICEFLLYLSLGWCYEAMVCTIVISVKRAFKWYPFCHRLDFDPDHKKAMDYKTWVLIKIGPFQLSPQKLTKWVSFESSLYADYNSLSPSFIQPSYTENSQMGQL